MSDANRKPSIAIRAAGWAVILMFLFGFAELVAFAAFRLVPQLSQRAYTAPVVSETEFAEYLEQRDPELGWPSKGWLAGFTDQDGARLSPANDALGQAGVCLSLFGDSFTFADEVDDASAWGNVLAGKLGCRVANFGVGGYGTDQAVLRLERKLAQGTDIGKSVILAVFPDDLNRTVNGWRYLVGGDPLGFKPMFVAEEDGYRLQPAFSGSYAEYQKLGENPAALLPGDQYLPGAPGFKRQTRVGFPFSLSMLRILVAEYRAIRSFGASPSIFWNYPSYFDTAYGPSLEKVATNLHVIGRFWALCEANDLNCAVMLIPDPEMLYQVQEGGAHTLGWLLQDIPPGATGLDATRAFTGVADICGALTRPEVCQGHFSPAGNQRIADFVMSAFGNSVTEAAGPGQ